MHETIYWVWNGWGLLLTAILAISEFLYILVAEKFHRLSPPERSIFAAIDLIAVVLTFVLSGWVAGLLALPVGFFLGIVLAWMFIPIFTKLMII